MSGGGRILRVRPGEAANDALFAAIDEAQRSDPLAPVTVVVQGQVVALDLRRRLAARRPVAAVRFETTARLVELLAAPGSSGRLAGKRPLRPAALRAAIRQSLSAAPGVLAEAVEHPSTEESLARSYELLRPLTTGERETLASMSTRAHDVVRIVELTRELVASSRYDLEDLASVAIDGLDSGAVDLDAVGTVLVHLPDPLPPSQVRLLAALAEHTALTVLAGNVHDGRPEDQAADAATEVLVRNLVDAGFEEAVAAEAAPLPPGADTPRFARVLGAPDAEEEVRLAARLLLSFAVNGGELGRSVVAVPSGEGGRSYLGMVEEIFSSSGVPWTATPTSTLGESPAGRLLLGLLDLFLEEEHPFGRGAVIRWLSSPGLSPAAPMWNGLRFAARARCLPAGAFDRCSRHAGIISGLEEWRPRLSSYARRRREEAADGTATGAETAEDLRAVIERLAQRGSELERCRGWGDVAAWAESLAKALFGGGDEHVPIIEAVASLGELADLEPLAPASTRDLGAATRRRQLRSAFSAALSAPAKGHGRFGAGPLVAPITALAGVQADLLLVLGCREGLLPGRTPEDPLVTEIERDAIELLARRERVEHRDRRKLLSLLMGSRSSIALYSRVERGASRSSYPSRWLAGDLFEGPFEEIASFPAALGLVARGELEPADSYELELAMASLRAAQGARLDGLFVSELGDLRRRVEAERERHRRGSRLNRFAGLVGPNHGTHEVYDESVSATRIEDLAKCPLRFMFSRLVRLQVLEAPERLDTISPLDRGSVIHAVLEEFVKATVLERDRFTGWQPEDMELLRAIGARHCEQAESRGLTGRPLYWRLERAHLLADLDRFVRLESDRLGETGGRPVLTEFGFGYDDVPPVEIGLRGGSVLRFRGKIDRIDEESDGTIRVIDYKSGAASGYEQMARDPLACGRHLQLPIYAKAAGLVREGGRRVVAEYRFCSAVAGFKRLPVELTTDLEERLVGALGALGGLVDAGTFPPRPGGEEPYRENCRMCDFTTICRLDRGAMWERAATETSIADYVALVEPAAEA